MKNTFFLYHLRTEGLDAIYLKLIRNELNSIALVFFQSDLSSIFAKKKLCKNTVCLTSENIIIILNDLRIYRQIN